MSGTQDCKWVGPHAVDQRSLWSPTSSPAAVVARRLLI